MSVGRVILVGAGPGDPELLTLRGAAALGRADVVVYDALAPAALLDLAPPEAERVNVGKRGHDAPTKSQADIEALLVARALAGRTVVRLKGGDPFVFGRGGEELSACRRAGVPVEVVPGVSSAFAAPAYAGIPLTDRRHAASFAVVTGHKDPSRVREALRWEVLGEAVDTLVILMGMRNLPELVQRLLDGGRDPATPAAAVADASTARQRVVEAPLEELPERVRAAGLGAPAVVVVGDVVRLREELRWFEDRPLFGRRVLVTRAADQAGALLEALRAAGAEPWPMPTIQVEAVEDPGPLDRALDALARFDALLFTSANGVRFLAERARQRGVRLTDAPGAVCVGPATARAALEAGLPVRLTPTQRFDAEGLLEALLQAMPVAGRRFLLPRAEASREVLPEGLRAAGAEVETLTVYRTVPACLDRPALRAALVRGELDALTFFSPSAARHLVAALDAEALEAARRCVVAAVGPVTAEALRELGLPPDRVPERAEAEAVVAVLADALADRSTGGAS